MSFKTTIDGLRQYFSNCGEILHVDLLLAKSGVSRGLAYLQFASDDAVEAALALNGQLLDARPIIVERSTGPPPPPSTAPTTSKVTLSRHDSAVVAGSVKPSTAFISRFAKSYNNQELKQLLESECGEIEIVKIAYDKMTGESKVRLIV
jgi:nucleolin